MIIFYYKIDSKIASIVSPIFSKSTFYPNYIAFSKLFDNTFYDYDVRTMMSGCDGFPPSICLIQVLAYVYGSIINGHLVEFFKIIALSIENESLGSFYTSVHYPIVI